MNRKSKILFLIAFLLTVATVILKIMTGIWLNLNTVLATAACGVVAIAVVLDARLYWDFLTMRTTKHGMNMGAWIVMVITALVCVNYLASRHNKTWDLTQEKLNSLSDQSVSLLKGLKDDIEFKVFYKGPQAQEDRQRVKQSLAAYQDFSGKIHVRYINSYVESGMALEYLKDLPDKDAAPVIVFLERNGKKVRVDQPFDEAAITSAMIKATRESEAKVYFIEGHGEKALSNEDDAGIKEFAKALGEASFKVESLNLIDKKEIPKDATVVAIVGPVMPYLDSELKWLRDYVTDGGRLFIALDPGQRHNLANLTKSLGVQFENNYIFTRTPIVGGGPATILGRTFDQNSEITRSFPTGSSFAVFPLASEVRPAQDKPQDFQTSEIVKSDNFSFTLLDPTKPIATDPQTKNVTVGISVKGQMPENKKPNGKFFEAVIFGDSDFISNRGLMMGINRDLGLNAIAQLAEQTDLLSIRPKIPKGSMVTLTQFQRLAIVIGGLSLPVILLILSGVMWFRRRGA